MHVHNPTHHSLIVSSEALNDTGRLLVPQEHVATVAATHDVLAFGTIEIHAFHCNNETENTSTYTPINNTPLIGFFTVHVTSQITGPFKPLND